MPLDDSSGQIELRILVPSAAREKVRIHHEREQEKPLGDSAIRAAHRAGLYAYDRSHMLDPPPGERERAVLAEVLAILAIYALAAAFIRPAGNFPLNDDTYFGLPALELARTGHFHLTIA